MLGWLEFAIRLAWWNTNTHTHTHTHLDRHQQSNSKIGLPQTTENHLFTLRDTGGVPKNEGTFLRFCCMTTLIQYLNWNIISLALQYVINSHNWYLIYVCGVVCHFVTSSLMCGHCVPIPFHFTFPLPCVDMSPFPNVSIYYTIL